jgi:PUA domain protein
MALKIRRRARLRRKDVTDLVGRLADEFGMVVPVDDIPIDEAEAGPHRLVLRGDEPIALLLGDRIAPTVRGLLAFPGTKRAVTVDMGAVRFIYNGADVMAPGITEADPALRSGDVVWVRDEKNRRPLAVGRAIMDGPTMAREEKGKAIETLHHVGDEIWRLGEEET